MSVLDLIKEVLGLDDEIQKLAAELYQQKSVLIMGRGYHYATCLEGALVSNLFSLFDMCAHFFFFHKKMKKSTLGLKNIILLQSYLLSIYVCRSPHNNLTVSLFIVLCRKSRKSHTCIQKASWLESLNMGHWHWWIISCRL